MLEGQVQGSGESFLWAPRTTTEESCPLGDCVKSKTAVTFSNENNFKCVKRGMDRLTE